MTYQPGDLILKKYRIEALVGCGAFAEVYRATHLELNTVRALKVLRRDAPGLGSTEYSDYQERFKFEAQLGAQLDHPNLIRVFDVEQDGADLILVMEYAPGGSLADRLKAARDQQALLSIGEALKVSLEVAEGLAVLHRLDAVHRDLKPSNILFDERGRAKVADFGLAQIPGGPSMRDMLSKPTPHPGTPGYMSPEQESQTGYLRSSSDVYTLGLVLFEMLSLRNYKNLKPGTTLRSLRPDTPRWLNEYQARMLAVEPSQRPSDGAEVAKFLRAHASKDINHFLEGRLAGRGQDTRPKWLAWIALPVIALAAILIFWAVPQFFPSTPGDPVATATYSPDRSPVVSPAIAATQPRLVGLPQAVEQTKASPTLPIPSPTVSPEPPVTATETILPSVEATASETSGLSLPGTQGTPLPVPGAAIAPENVDQLVQLATWGIGAFEFLAWSPNNDLLGVGGAHGINLYDTKTWQEARQIWIPSSLTSLAYAPDGNLIAAGLVDGKIVIHSARDGGLVQTLEGHTQAVTSLAFSPDGAFLATGSADSTVALWQISDWSLVQTLSEHTAVISSLDFAADGKTLASGSDDTTVRIWQISTGVQAQVLTGHVQPVNSVSFSPDGATLMTGSPDTLQFWPTTSYQRSRFEPGIARSMRGATYSPDGSWIAIGSSTGSITLEEEATRKRFTIQATELENCQYFCTGEVEDLEFSPDSTLLATIGNNLLEIWRVDNRAQVERIDGGRNSLVAFSADDRLLASQGNLIQVWQLSSWRNRGVLETGLEQPITRMAFSPDRKVLGVSDGRVIQLWNWPDWSPYWIIREAGLGDIFAFSSDGKELAVGGDMNGYVWIYDLVNQERINILKTAHGPADGVAFSADNQYLASGGEGVGPFIWRLEDYQALKNLRGPTCSLLFSGDGKYLASSGDVWSVPDWQMQYSIGADCGLGISFTADSRLLAYATRSYQGAGINLIQVEDGTSLGYLQGLTSVAVSLVFSPDGKYLAAGLEDGGLQIWGAIP